MFSDSMVKHLTGSGISKKNHAKIKTNPILVQQLKILLIISSQVFRRNWIFLLVHSGTNDLKNEIKTLTKVRKVVATVEEMDKERKFKLGFSSIIGRGKVNKKDEIVAVNDRLQKCCLSNGLNNIDNTNIDASCLNRGKLYLNRQDTSILADNFGKSFPNSGWFDESFLNKDEKLDCTCNNPNVSNESDFTNTLRLSRSKYLKNSIFNHLNINSIRNKFENLKDGLSRLRKFLPN